jgi:hypothetical protein
MTEMHVHLGRGRANVNMARVQRQTRAAHVSSPYQCRQQGTVGWPMYG